MPRTGLFLVLFEYARPALQCGFLRINRVFSSLEARRILCTECTFMFTLVVD